MSATLEDRDGWLFVRHVYRADLDPRSDIYWWPTDCRASTFISNYGRELLGCPLIDCGSGIYRIDQTRIRVHLTNGGRTQATLVEHEEVPVPKVRKGIQLRWNRGRWEKYLKRGGWTTA